MRLGSANQLLMQSVAISLRRDEPHSPDVMMWLESNCRSTVHSFNFVNHQLCWCVPIRLHRFTVMGMVLILLQPIGCQFLESVTSPACGRGRGFNRGRGSCAFTMWVSDTRNPLPAATASDLSRKRERCELPSSAPIRGPPHTTGSADSQ